MATLGRCIITYSRQPPGAKYFGAWQVAMARLAEQQAGQLSVVVIIDSNAATPDESARKLIRAALQRYERSIERFAYVVEGRGFGAAAMRSAISLVSLAARTPYRLKVFASVDEAGVWLARAAREAGSALEERALGSLADSMRDKLKSLARTG
jgi:hypothetical protein